MGYFPFCPPCRLGGYSNANVHEQLSALFPQISWNEQNLCFQMQWLHWCYLCNLLNMHGIAGASLRSVTTCPVLLPVPAPITCCCQCWSSRWNPTPGCTTYRKRSVQPSAGAAIGSARCPRTFKITNPKLLCSTVTSSTHFLSLSPTL